MPKEIHYRFVYRGNEAVDFAGENLIISFHLNKDKSTGSTIHTLAKPESLDILKEELGFKNGDKFKLVHAEKTDIGFVKYFAHWHVVFDGIQFFEDLDEDNSGIIDIQ